MEAYAAATPTHLYVRIQTEEGPLAIETLDQGKVVDEASYHRRHRIAPSSVERGIFLSPLPDKAIVAYFLSNRGVLRARAGEARGAMRDFARAIRLYPLGEAAWYNRGLERLKAGDFAAAAEDFSRAIDIHPLDAQAFNNRGLAHLRLGDREAARRDFEEALRIDPAQREARENLRLLEAPSVSD